MSVGLKSLGTAIMVILVAVLVMVTKPTITYYFHVFKLLSAGEGLYQSNIVSAGNRGPFDIFNATVYTDTSEIRERMGEYGRDAAEASKPQRQIITQGIGSGNFLGAFVLNDAAMLYGTIALGANKNFHTKMRPFFDETLSGDKRKWNEASLSKDIRKILQNQKIIHIRDDLVVFCVQLLFNHWMGDNMTIDEARDFAAYQKKRLMVSLLPKFATYFMPGLVSAIQEKNQMYLKRIKQLIIMNHKREVEEDISRIAWGVLDALTFAGGLGVPTLLHHCLAVIANGEAEEALKQHPPGSSGAYKIDLSKLDILIQETSRLYPAVSEVPYTRDEKREVLALGSAFRQEKVWGTNAQAFKLRDRSQYELNLAAFAEFGGSTRRCPGKDLALTICREFLNEIDRRGWEVIKDENGKGGERIKNRGYDFPGFSISLSD
eukprot:jgi/Bigna1/71762/fgenesh1_pg.17_\